MTKKNARGIGKSMLFDLPAQEEAPEIHEPEIIEEAPEILEPEKPTKKTKKKMADLYTRQTYWIRNDFIKTIADYAYTERINIRQAVNKLIELGLDQVKEDYEAENKTMMEYKKGDF